MASYSLVAWAFPSSFSLTSYCFLHSFQEVLHHSYNCHFLFDYFLASYLNNSLHHNTTATDRSRHHSNYLALHFNNSEEVVHLFYLTSLFYDFSSIIIICYHIEVEVLLHLYYHHNILQGHNPNIN